MLVTGGLGGLGLICSFHCATEHENPIITTSRSGKLPPNSGPSGQNLYEALTELVPVYNVKLDVGNSKAVADLFAWVQRPGLPFEERTMLIDDVVEQLKYKMNTLPHEALVALQDFLLETRDKLGEIIGDLMSRETKVEPGTIREIQEKAAAVSDMIQRLAPKVGTSRSGRCRLVGGVPPPAYSVPEWSGTAAQRESQIDKDVLLGLMQEEMQERAEGEP